MEKWANEYDNVQFLTVCVDSLGVARQFQRMFVFANVVNCHIPARDYMPVGFGQLGCSGFIVADEHGYFVSRKTTAFLDYGEAAFRYLENLLEQRFGIKKTDRKNNSLPPACKVISDRTSAQSEEKKEEDISQPVPSVGIASMDDEHEKCEVVLSLLLETPNSKTLEKALVELTAHFAHEEKLMKTHGFGNADSNDKFSPFHSHVKDHERMLDYGYQELARASKQPDSCSIDPKKKSGISS
jgi:hypothetical protein